MGVAVGSRSISRGYATLLPCILLPSLNAQTLSRLEWLYGHRTRLARESLGTRLKCAMAAGLRMTRRQGLATRDLTSHTALAVLNAMNASTFVILVVFVSHAMCVKEETSVFNVQPNSRQSHHEISLVRIPSVGKRAAVHWLASLFALTNVCAIGHGDMVV